MGILRGASGRASPCHFGLYLVELITVNNGIVVVFNEVHGKLTCVLDGLAADEILTEGLLHQDIAAVFFILQDTADAGDGPFRRVLEAWDLLCFQFFFQHPQTGAAQIVIIDPSDDLRLFQDDLRFAIFTLAVAVQFLYWMLALPASMARRLPQVTVLTYQFFGKVGRLFSPFFQRFLFCAE